MSDVPERPDWWERPFAENSQLNLNSYYFAFSPTGVRAVDRLLSAVATAGDMCHETSDWANERLSLPTPAQVIQRMGERAAEDFRRLRNRASTVLHVSAENARLRLALENIDSRFIAVEDLRSTYGEQWSNAVIADIRDIVRDALRVPGT